MYSGPVALLLACACGLAAADPKPAALLEDVIILDNGQRIVGTIVQEAEADANLVSVFTGSGIMRFDHRRIKLLELGYASRRAQVKDTDATGLYALAQWCRTQGRQADALDLLEKVLALPDGDPAARVLYLRLVDEVRGPELALPLYKAYRAAGGDDAATLTRLAQLEKVKADYEREYGSAVAASKVDFAREGIETRQWMPESPQYFNPVEIERVSIDRDDGTANNALKLTCKPGGQDKAAIRLGMAMSGELQPRFAFRVANQGKKSVGVGIAIKTGERYVYHESEAQIVPAGGLFTELVFDLKGSTWKSEATGWRYAGSIAKLDNIREIQILVHNGSGTSTLVVDDVRFLGVKDL
jgi:hypothetical protein